MITSSLPVRESQHVDLIQTSFFTLLGWETASEKDSGFGFVTRALGVQIDLSDCHIGLVKVCNTMSRRQELEQLIDEILASPTVSGSVLTSLRGRLQFCDNQIFGKVLSSHCDRKKSCSCGCYSQGRSYLPQGTRRPGH